MATSLVSIDNKRKVNMRILNPYKQDITIRQGEKLGELHEFHTSIPMFDSEDPSQSDNYESVRRIPLAGQTCDRIRKTTSGISDITSDTSEVSAGLLADLESKIPEHLKDMMRGRKNRVIM